VPERSHDGVGTLDIGAVAPDTGQPVDQHVPILGRPLAAVRLLDGFAHERRHRRAAPPALGGEDTGALFVEVELCAAHGGCMTYTPRHDNAKYSIRLSRAYS
jgi:hypothetical protein